MGIYSKLASSIYNDLHGGLKGLSNEWTLSIEQLEDDIADLRLKLIQDKIESDIRNKKKYATALKCIKVDCQPIDNCECFESTLPGDPLPHFQIPVPLMDSYNMAIIYIGTTDMSEPFAVYTDFDQIRAMKHRRIKMRRPYVFLSIAPNKNGFLDGYIFNAPYIQQLTVVAVFKDIRKYLDEYCCEFTDNSENLNSEIAASIIQIKSQLYQTQLSNERKTVI